MRNLKLNWPPATNNLYATINGKRVLSKRGKAYAKHVGQQVMINRVRRPLAGNLKIVVQAVPPDKRKRDIDNICKAIFDSLQKAGVYEDDSHITELHVYKHASEKPGHVVVSVEIA